MNVYETCRILESEKFIIRLFQDEDCNDLLKVYSDKNALPFFNSDNCDGYNFYYPSRERMTEAMEFWHMSYKNKCFVRLSIVDKAGLSVIGTVELCLRVSKDEFNNMGILRLDVRSDYEQEKVLYEIFSLIASRVEEMLGCKGVITKVPIYAVERMKAVQRAGFVKAEHFLIGKNGYAYDGYFRLG